MTRVRANLSAAGRLAQPISGVSIAMVPNISFGCSRKRLKKCLKIHDLNDTGLKTRHGFASEIERCSREVRLPRKKTINQTIGPTIDTLNPNLEGATVDVSVQSETLLAIFAALARAEARTPM